jgi:hypothetical protein
MSIDAVEIRKGVFPFMPCRGKNVDVWVPTNAKAGMEPCTCLDPQLQLNYQ